jgi:replicative DNA helicase
MASDASSPAAGSRLDRVPPCSEDAERGVLGSVLLDADRVMDLCVERQLRPDSFYVPAHQQLFDVMLSMAGEGRPIDLLTVTERLRTAGLLDRIGGQAALEHLVDSTPTPAHAEYYIDVVRQKHLLRLVIARARDAERACYGTDTDADKVLGQIEQSFFDITGQQHGAMRPWREMVNEVVAQLDIHKPENVGVRTGFRNIDRVLVALHPSNMIILAARPAMGKTSLAMNIAENVALGHGPQPARPVGIFSLEMSCHDLVKRMICSRAEVPSQRITDGFISQTNHRKLITAADVLVNAPVYLDDTAGLDINELRARARRMVKKHQIQLVVVDYLQLLHADEYTRQGRQVEMTAVSGGLKGMAKELHVPVLVVSQLSRQPERRSEKEEKPKLSDLRDSGSIEQDADVVVFLRRPCKIAGAEEHDNLTLALMDVAKHRNGPTREDIRMEFDAEYTRFRDAVHGVDETGVMPAYLQEENA